MRRALPFLLVLLAAAGVAVAQVGVSTTTTYYRESGGPLENQVVTPSVRIRGDIREILQLRAGWEADVVSGASVAVVDNPTSAPDAITSATKYDDFRNVASAGFTLRSEFATLSADYSYGNESDYRSHAFRLGASAELFERNTRFALSYGRGFDQVCNLRQPRAQEAVDRQRLPNSEGCFSGADDREALDVELHTFQGGWTQAWTPILVTQVTLTGQILNGYQGNPYRAVWLGRTAAQEFHPENRQRWAGGVGARLFVRPLRGAIQLFGRLYRDSWDVTSATAELAWEQTLGESLRVRARGRYYTQTAAAFFSDDYARFPRGQYFTGDRELSGMSSWVVGGSVRYDLPPAMEERTLEQLSIVLKFDYLRYDFRDYTYGGVGVPNDTGIALTFGLDAQL
ncbi:MAG: DUF3570 domain-containing protein [Myxococcota bacterium]